MTNEEVVIQVADHEHRIGRLEEADRKHNEFRKDYYKDREDRIFRDAQLDIKINNINENITKLVAWQESQKSKPGKRWESIVDKALWAVLAALIAFVLGRLGL